MIGRSNDGSMDLAAGCGWLLAPFMLSDELSIRCSSV